MDRTHQETYWGNLTLMLENYLSWLGGDLTLKNELAIGLSLQEKPVPFGGQVLEFQWASTLENNWGDFIIITIAHLSHYVDLETKYELTTYEFDAGVGRQWTKNIYTSLTYGLEDDVLGQGDGNVTKLDFTLEYKFPSKSYIEFYTGQQLSGDPEAHYLGLSFYWLIKPD